MKQPLILAHFEEFFKLLHKKETSDRSWSVSARKIAAKNYDLKAVNPNRKAKEDIRTPQELLSIIESHTDEIKNVISLLRRDRV